MFDAFFGYEDVLILPYHQPWHNSYYLAFESQEMQKNIPAFLSQRFMNDWMHGHDKI